MTYWPTAYYTFAKRKFGKSRLVPLHPACAKRWTRISLCAGPLAPTAIIFFCQQKESPLTYPTVNTAFHGILRHASIAPDRSKRPRIHDLRHTFATRVLQQGRAEQRSIARRTVALMTYMGHENPRYTYWYLQATPELMADIAAAGENLVGEGGRSPASVITTEKEVRQ